MLLIAIEAALFGSFMWVHGPTQQFVQQRKTQMTDQASQPKFVWVVVNRHGIPPFVKEDIVGGPYTTESDANVACGVFKKESVDPFAHFEVQPREA